MPNRRRVLAGRRIRHKLLLKAERFQEAAAFAKRYKLLQQPVLAAIVTTPGGAGVAVAAGARNGIIPPPKQKIGINVSLDATSTLAATNWAGLAGVEPFTGLPVYAQTQTSDSGGIRIIEASSAYPELLEASEQPQNAATAVLEEPVTLVERVGGVAREKLPAGVWWGQVIRDYVNPRFKLVRLADGGEGTLWVTWKMQQKYKGKMMHEWVRCEKSREPGQAGDWVVWDGQKR